MTAGVTAPTPRVSVLMTTHDGAATIADSIASILAQDMPDFELVIVDDGSTDTTPLLLAALHDPRISVIRNDPRRGIAEARNTGFARCRAAYVAALDHDDLSDPSRLRLQAAHLDAHPDLVLVGTAVRLLNASRTTAEDQLSRTTPGLLRLLLHLDNPLAWSSIMVRREAASRLDPFLRTAFEPADDFDCYHRLLALGEIARLDAPLTIYRWHAGNTTHSTGPRIASRAVEVLTRSYAPWFGTGAEAAAALVIRHCSDRVPACDRSTLAALHGIIRRVADELGKLRPDLIDEFEAGTRKLLWRTTRAAMRSGRPWLLRAPAPAVDGAASLLVGTARAAMRAWRPNRPSSGGV